jgi:biopolymer transport protein ExbB
MLGLFSAGGALMWPILLCSVISFTLICERYWALRLRRVIPENTLNHAMALLNHPEKSKIEQLARTSPLGRILATALKHSGADMYLITERVQDAGRHVLHDLEKYFSALGTIAMITPLLGLLGTVIGMIDVFSTIMMQGVGGQSQALAGGIATALLTTAAGLLIAIPTLVAHRYFERHLENFSVDLEQQAGLFLDAIRRKKAAQRKSEMAETLYLQEATA